MRNAVAVPAGHVFQSDGAGAFHVRFPDGIDGLIQEVAIPSLVPRHPPGPLDVVFRHDGHIGNRAVFGDGQNFAREILGERLVCRNVFGRIVPGFVDVEAHDVVFCRSRIPVGVCRIFRVPDPDEVLHAFDIDHFIVNQVVKCLECGSAFVSPPEPGSARFVYGTEYGGCAGVLQLQKVVGDFIDVGNDLLISCRSRVPAAI